MPFIPNARRSKCSACDNERQYDDQSESVRSDTPTSLHAARHGAAGGADRPDARAIRIPLNEWTMPEKMRHVADWLASNFARPVRIREAAALVAMSERSLLRRFTREIGMTPSAWLTQVRLAHARTMLECTALPVDSIARRSGLGSGDYLAHLFRRHLDMSPTEYRRAHARSRIHVACGHCACGTPEQSPSENDAGR